MHQLLDTTMFNNEKFSHAKTMHRKNSRKIPVKPPTIGRNFKVFALQQWTTFTTGGQRLFLAFFCAMATKIFLNNANGPNNYHANFENFLSYCWLIFIKILEVGDFPIGLYYVWQFSEYIVLYSNKDFPQFWKELKKTCQL